MGLRWLSMARTKPYTIRLTEEEYKKAKELADALTRGKVSLLISLLINEKYKQIFGDKA